MTHSPDERDRYLHSLISRVKAPPATPGYFEALFARVEVTPQKAGIRRRSVTVGGTVLDPEVLRQLYVKERLSINQVAARLGVGRSVVERNLRDHSITRTRRQRLPKELLEELYVRRRLSAEAVAARAGVSKDNVLADLRYWNLPRRRAGRGPKPLTREFAERVYQDLLRDIYETDPLGPEPAGEGPAGSTGC